MASGREASTKSARSARKEPSSTVKSYLIAYNFIQTLGWSYLLYQLINFYFSPGNNQKSLYETVKYTVIIFQNAAVLEVVHAILRFVSSSPAITALQVSSRVFLVCGVFLTTNASHETVGLPLALIAWSITEVIRYGNYTLSLIGMVPYFLIWLRYTTFIVLYPIGVSGELLCMYAAQNEVEKTKIFTVEMPNTLNFIFNYRYLLWFVMLIYIPVFPQLYAHMFSQRKKVLGSSIKKHK